MSDWQLFSESKPSEGERVIVAVRETSNGYGRRPATYQWVTLLATWNGKWQYHGTISSNYSDVIWWKPMDLPPVPADQAVA